MAGDKRCGNCRHWENGGSTRTIGWCKARPPSPIPDSWAEIPMHNTDGTDCPTFERKEASDAQAAD